MNNGELNGYLMESTGRIFSKVDERTGKRLIDEILDAEAASRLPSERSTKPDTTFL